MSGKSNVYRVESSARTFGGDEEISELAFSLPATPPESRKLYQDPWVREARPRANG